MLLDQHLDEAFHGEIRTQRKLEGLASTHGAVIPLLVLEGVRVDAVGADQHEVVVQVRCRARSDLERLVAACRCTERVSIRFCRLSKVLDIPEMMALVDAMAGMMFFTTPCVSDHVTPSMLNSFARAAAMLYSHPMCSGSSVSIFLSKFRINIRVS